MQVTISFPCSIEEWRKVTAIHAMYATSYKAIASNDDGIIDPVSPEEAKLLDEALVATHERGETRLLDTLNAERAGFSKPNMTNIIINYFVENPGASTKDAKEFLGNKYIDQYPNLKIGMSRITKLIHTLTSRGLLINNCTTNGRNGKIYVVENQ